MSGPRKASPFSAMIESGLQDDTPAATPDATPTTRPAEPTPRATPPAASIELPAPPPGLRLGEKRESIGVRVLPQYKQRLDRLVADLRHQGWPLSQHHIMEHLLDRLDDPEFVRQMLADIAEKSKR